jgi:hypothetical protein
MNSSLPKRVSLTLAALLCLGITAASLSGYEIFIYRPGQEKHPLTLFNRITLHGEYFVQYQNPSSFPSFNDMSGPVDRWNFGFQNIVDLTPSTEFLAQMVAHDDGGRRTKFDWHFSLRQKVFENLRIIIGHDSNHDSEYQSILNGKVFFLNRNYIGIGIPIEFGRFYIEPFTWFFHHSNQYVHLDYSGEKLKQEFGLRLGWWPDPHIGVHFQAFSQMDKLFSEGRAYMADLIIRVRLLDFLELSAGTRIWKDTMVSPLGIQNKYYKIFWGVVFPF